MPDSRPLDRLRKLLANEFSAVHPSRATAWGDPKAMSDVLREVKRSFGRGEGLDLPQRDVLVDAVREFGRYRRTSNFRQLKYVCYGVTLPVESAQWRIIDRADVFEALLREVKEHESSPRQFRRCYQGLLSGYFGFDRHIKPEGIANRHWLSLRGFLGEQLDPLLHISRSRDQAPHWLEALSEHRNLLQDDPCSRYANALKQGNTEDLKQVCAGLGIENTSWVWEEALMAYVRSVVNSQEASFKAGLAGVLSLLNGHTEWKLPPSVALRATAMTVARYADCEDQREHVVLRDICLQRIGNPWLERTAWEANVRYEPARQMVEGWLKRRLIKDFFELLSHDGAADQRRVNYWVEWEPLITDMWFVLGGEARRNKSSAFSELRKRMEGRERWLDGGDDSNNAFIMRIGSLLVVEFGMTGNACYIYDAKNSGIELERRLLSLQLLKRRNHPSLKAWLSHNSGWEYKFNTELRRLVGTIPRDLKRQAVSKVSAFDSSNFNPWLKDAVASQQKISASTSNVQCGENFSVEKSSSTPVAKIESKGGGTTSAVFPPSAVSGKYSDREVASRVKEPQKDDVSSDNGPSPGNYGVKPPAQLGKWPVFKRTDEPLSPTKPKVVSGKQAKTIAKRLLPFTEIQFENVRARCARLGVKWEDNRSKGGAFWVLIPDREMHADFSTILEGNGFHYKHGRGFWLEKGE